MAAQTFRVGVVPAGPRRQAGSAAADPVAAFWSNCDEVASLGFRSIEFNNTRSHILETYASRISEFRDELARRNLTLAGVARFSHMSRASADLIETHLFLGRFLSAVGGRYITHMLAPGDILNEPSDESEYDGVDIGTWARNATEIGTRLAGDYGIRLAYHPEQGEIRRGIYKRILMEVRESALSLVADTGHIASAGADSAEFCRSYANRLACVHLKDFSPHDEPVKAGNVDFGNGAVNLRSVMRVLSDTRFAGYVMAESGGSNRRMREYLADELKLAL